MSVRVSVVVPVYNAEETLRESLASLQKQTCESIEVVCVDDGSTDGSWEILSALSQEDCRIVCVRHTENRGTHVARKTGVMKASGEYVMFMDPDDAYTPDACEILTREMHDRKLDVLRFRMKFIHQTDVVRAKQLEHSLQEGFGDLWGHRAILQAFFLTSGSACYLTDKIYKLTVCCEGFSLTSDDHLTVLEDRYACLAIFSCAETYGEVSDVCYCYHIERGITATMNDQGSDAALVAFDRHCRRGETLGSIRRLTKVLQRRDPGLACDEIFVAERERFISQLQSQVKELSPAEQDDVFFLKMLSAIQKHWAGEDRDILLARLLARFRIAEHSLDLINRSIPHRLAFIVSRFGLFFARIRAIAHREGVRRAFECLFFRDAHEESPQLDCKTVYIESIKRIHGRHCVEGIIRDGTGSASMRSLCIFHLSDDVKLNVPLRPGKYRFYPTTGVSGDILDVYFFRFYLEDLPKNGGYSFNLQNGEDALRLDVAFGLNAPLSNRYAHAYCRFGERLLMRSGASSVRLQRWRFLRGVFCECLLIVDLLRHRTLPETLAVFVRMSLPLVRLFCPRGVWVLSDKLRLPDDNGLALFRYLREVHPNVNACFLISRDSPKRKELSRFGKTIHFGGIRHFYLMLVAEAVISSEAYSYVKPPTFMVPYANITWKSLRVFLQHGVIESDLSAFYGRSMEGFDLFTVSRIEERSKILADPWGYDEQSAVLTGLARYDQLHSGDVRAITIMFTWRYYLARGLLPNKERVYDESFLLSTYWETLFAFVSDQRIHAAAREKGLFVQVVLHPCLWAIREALSFPDGLFVINDEKTFSEIVAESAMFVTDYSSLYNDFVYLRKPVLFYQFDRAEFAENTGRKLNFSPNADDAPGPVCFNHEDAVDALVLSISRNFELDAKYAERVESWFPQREGSSCSRIYQAIQKKISEQAV